MNDAAIEEAAMVEAYWRVRYDIPTEAELRRMPLLELYALSWNCEKGHPKQRVIEQEISRRSGAAIWSHQLIRLILSVVGIIARFLGLR